MSKRIFVSHSTKDNAIADLIYDGLRAAGFDEVWVDHRHGIEPGDQDWELAIREALGECDVVLYLMSQNSLESKWCKREISRGDGLGKPIFVAKLEEIQKSNDRFMQIETSQYASFMARSDAEMQIIVRALKGEHAPDLPKPITSQTITGVDTMRRHLEYLKNPFRGYDDILAQVQSMLGEHVLQIVGPGGLGKSRLAAELAMNHSTGAIWYRCSETGQVADLEALLYEHMHLPADTTLSNVLAVLSEKKPLIVVDNAEVAIANPDLQHAYEDLLQKIVGRNVSVVLTTRVVWTELKPRREYAPSALSIDIAAQIALDFAIADNRVLSESDARNLADKARLHPGLIEFSIGQLRERSLDSVLRQLSELTSRDVQAALYEMVGKTVEQMSKQADNGTDAEALLVRMPLLQAAFPLDAIKAIAPDEMKEDIDQLEDALVTLQRWQFVRRDLITDRYSLGELVRETLGQPEEEVFWPYADYYTTRAGEIFGLPLEQWKDHDHDLPNILALGDALVEYTSQSDLGSSEEIPVDQRLTDAALAFALNSESFVIERPEYRRLAWLEMGLMIAQFQNQPKHEAHFYTSIASIKSVLGEQHTALDYVKQSLAIYRTLEDQAGEARALNNIGLMLDRLAERQEALEHFDQALSLVRKLKDEYGESVTLNNIGLTLHNSGDSRSAIMYYEQVLPLKQKTGDRIGEAGVLLNIGLALSTVGDKKLALIYYEEALPIFRAFGNKRGQAQILNNIGLALYGLRRYQEAKFYYEQALTLFIEVGDRTGETLSYYNIGQTYNALGDIDQAITYLTHCVELDKQISHPDLEQDQQVLERLIRKRDELRRG